MTSKLIIGNINQFAGFVEKNPAIMSIPAFISLRSAFEASKSATGCKCNKSKALTEYRPQFEASLSVLTPNEQSRLKTLLDTEQLCYYKKNPNGTLNLTCF